MNIKITASEYAGDSLRDITVECDSLINALTLMAQFYERDSEECDVDKEDVKKCDEVDWSEAPDWATMYGKAKVDGDHVWYNDKFYAYIETRQLALPFQFGTNFYKSPSDIICIAKREV